MQGLGTKDCIRWGTVTHQGSWGDPGDISVGEAGGHTAQKEEGMLSSSKVLTGKGHAAVAEPVTELLKQKSDPSEGSDLTESFVTGLK